MKSFPLAILPLLLIGAQIQADPTRGSNLKGPGDAKSYSIDELINLTPNDEKLSAEGQGIERIRREVLRNNAIELGARGGFLYRAKQINQFLERNDQMLDKRFQFLPLLIDMDILPPVVLEVKNTRTSDAKGQTIRIADASYTIKQNARFITVPPTWRDYLYVVEQEVELPHHSVVPDTDEEKTYWQKHVEMGWSEGVQQADEIYDLALNELEQDYIGMVNFHRLLEQGKVRRPKVERNHLGVTGDANNMAVGDRVSQIKRGAGFELDSYDWASPVLPEYKYKIKIDAPQEEVAQDIQRKLDIAQKQNRAGIHHSRQQKAIEENRKNSKQAFEENSKKLASTASRQTNRKLPPLKPDTAPLPTTLDGTIDDWRNSWADAKTARYLRYYADNFTLPSGLSRSQWEWRRRGNIANTKKIEVQFNDVEIVYSDDEKFANVNFTQKYRFDQYQGTVPKVMLFAKQEDGTWRIVFEQETAARSEGS